MNAPCYRCARRAINCHTACTDYAEYRKVCNQIQTAREAERKKIAAFPRPAAPKYWECVGCGFEHNCRTNGCAVMLKAAELLEE